MGSYTPDTYDVREAWLNSEYEERGEQYTDDDLRAEFNRWLEQVKAEAWREGARDVMEAIGAEIGTLTFLAPYNPYERPAKSVREVIVENGGTGANVEAWA